MGKRGLAKKAFKATAAVATFGGSVAAEKVATTLRNKDDPGIDVAVVERIEAANRLWEAARAAQTGRWECLRWGSEHSADGEAPLD